MAKKKTYSIYDEKAGEIANSTINKNARISTKAINDVAAKSTKEKEEALRKAQEYYNKNAGSGSLASKANMVRAYNEKNNQNK